MISKPVERVLEALAAHGKQVKGSGSGFVAQCPSHSDETPSLSISEGDDGRALLCCHAGCEVAHICASLGLQLSDLFVHSTNGTASGTHSTQRAFIIRDVDGREIARHHRIDRSDGTKSMWWSRSGVKGLGGIKVSNLPLYGSELLPTNLESTVVVTEGEVAAEALRSRGILALGTVTGAGDHKAKCPSRNVLKVLTGRDVVLWPDDDEIGRAHMRRVANELRGIARSVRVVKWKDSESGADAADFAGTNDEVCALLDAAESLQSPTQGDKGSAENVGPSPAEPGRRVDVILGTRHEKNRRLILSEKETLPTAKAYVAQFHSHPDGRTLRAFAGVFFEWRDNRYAEVEDSSLRKCLQEWLHDALKPAWNAKEERWDFLDFYSNPRTVHAATDTIRDHVLLPATTAAPSWLEAQGTMPPACEILPCKSANLHLPTMTAFPTTPALFNFNALDFDFDPQAAPPVRWLAFLVELFGNDIESINLLQEWFGYILIADTSQQKILLIVGPRRSGKGTVARIQQRLVGVGNVVAPTVSSLAGPFGLQPLIGKSLAIVSDARFTGENIAAVIERLLCISGEDAISVDRKFLSSVTMKLPTRFVFLTNELPRLSDSSVALAGRFLVLRLTKSFYGEENVNLTNELLEELPGILVWAIEGWHRLNERGHFVEPQSSRSAVQDLEDLSSPVSAFLRERCVVGPGHRVVCQALYAAWKAWCDADGRTSCTTSQTFGRDLSAAAPGVTRRQGTEVSFYEGVGLR